MPVKDHGSSKMQMWFSTPLGCSGSDLASMGLASTVTLKASHDWDGIQGMHCGLANAAAVSSRAVNAAQHWAITSSLPRVSSRTCVKRGPIAVWAPCELPSPAGQQRIEHISGALLRLWRTPTALR